MMRDAPPIARLVLIGLVVAAYATLLAALVSRPPPLWFVGTLLLSLVTFLNVCICFLSLSVFVDVVARAPAGAGAVALTFDDGPHPVHTIEVLDHLDRVGAKATFFVIGAKAEKYPEVVAEIARRGHELGLHSFAHDHLLFMRGEAAALNDTIRTQDAIERAAGVRPKLFRPPVGFTSPRTRKLVQQLGLVVVGWSARAFDGAGRPTTDRILARIEPSLHDGAIVLLHDAFERSDEAPTSVAALPALLATLQSRGLRAVTFSELVRGDGVSDPTVVAQPAP